MFIFMWHACYEDVWEPNHDPNTLSTTAPLEAFGCPTWERETRRWSVGIARAHARGGCDSAGIEATPSTHEGTAGVHVCREHGREPTGVKRHRALHGEQGPVCGAPPNGWGSSGTRRETLRKWNDMNEAGRYPTSRRTSASTMR